MGLKDGLLTSKLTDIKKQFETAIITNGRKGAESLIRSKKLIGLIHEYLKEELIAQGVRKDIIFPPIGESNPEICLSGFLKCKNQDITVIPYHFEAEEITDGVLIDDIDEIGRETCNKSISINIRSQLSSIGKNFDTLYERTFAETLNLHLRMPNLVCGEVYLIPLVAYDDKLMESRRVGFREKLPKGYIRAFHAINNRGATTQGDVYKYERVSLLIVDFRENPPKIISDVKSMVDEGIITEEDAKKITLKGLTIADFISDILKVYEQRHGSLNDLKNLPANKNPLDEFI